MRKSLVRVAVAAAAAAVVLSGCSAATETPATTNSASASAELEIVDTTFDGPHGSVPIRIYQVPGSSPENGLLWLHGGAFMFGDLEMLESHWVAQQLATEDRVVIAVDYRLAPIPEGLGPDAPPRDGHFFPVASEEVAALTEAMMTTDDISDADSWVIGGASAGGNIAAGVTLRLRDSGAAEPAGLLMAYPFLHAELPEFRPELVDKLAALPEPTSEQQANTGASDLALHYVGGDSAVLADPYAFPGGHNLENLPSTFIVNSDADFLRASGEAYASELAAAGVDVQVVRETGTVHGHLDGPDKAGSTASIHRMDHWLAGIESGTAD